jgi:hypothetical protein
LDDTNFIKEEISRLRAVVADLDNHRQESRVRRAEDFAAFKVQITSVEVRLASVEAGVSTLMTHSTWLLRILIGGLVVAVLQFALKGGLNVIG